jgi:hypothetical protein
MKTIKPYASEVMKKDEEFIMTKDILPGVNLSALWVQLSDKSKENIWKYLQSLVTIGSILTAIPQSMMDSIEQMAEKMSKEMTEVPDMSALLSLINK